MKKKLAIIGGKEEQAPLVYKAKEMEIETHCFSWEKNVENTFCKGIADYFHPISILEKEQILEKCKEIKIDGVTAICNDYAVPTVAYVAQNMGLPGNRYEDMLIAINKYKARERFLQKGVSSPHFTLAKKGEKPNIAGFKYPLIVKPTDRSASLGVIKANTEKEFQNALAAALELSFEGEAIVEEFVSGLEMSVDTMSWNGKHHVFAMRDKITSKAPVFVELAHNEPSSVSKENVAKIEVETRKALNALNIKLGACDTEIKITEDGNVYLIEVNPRMGGDRSYDLIKYSTGHDYMKIHINAALGYWEEPTIINHYYIGMYYWCEGQEWVKQIIDNKDKYPEIIDAEITKEKLFPLKCNGDRSGYFIYKSDRKRSWNEKNKIFE